MKRFKIFLKVYLLVKNNESSVQVKTDSQFFLQSLIFFSTEDVLVI